MAIPSIPSSEYTADIFGIEFPSGVSVPKGFTCYSIPEIRQAKEILTKMKVSKFLVKSVFGITGIDIFHVDHDEEFEEVLKKVSFQPNKYVKYKTQGAVLLEEKIEIKYENGESETPTMHFFGKNFDKRFLSQKIKKDTFIGSKTSKHSDRIRQKCEEQAIKICNAIYPKVKGPWGVDFLVDGDDNVFFIDPNFGR